ncbi:hypothetical protein D910_00608 [Dendroctonus ponderosae]|uniref:Endonuclease/exonuclease/phosphatase domain-containing protein n=1 Tax=Dendroctonus ponderosae TaxID=77166 RepID=U4US44_DENPD|nr:hypothetical protein D910_00608 [Dendroctonus ponderosae]
MDFSDTNGDCFINVDNRHKVIDCGKGAGYVHVELEACVLVSCYFSPNRGIGEFESLLHNLGDFIRQTRQSGKRVVMGGDLNAKTNIIGSKTTNQRGRLFQEWIIANELVILNQGDIPTFSNANGSTVIDFTAATEEICQRVTNWRVEAENENLSDHNNIRFVIESRPRDRIPNLGRAGWIVGEEEMRRILAAWRSRHLDSTLTKVKPEQLIESITELLNRHAKRKSGNARRPPVYWWNSDIAALRSICISSRRQLTRAQKQHGSRSSMQELVETHKGNKHALKKEIRKSKVSKWKQLCTELDSDIWGKAYQIVTKRLNLRNRSYPDEKTTSLQIEKLFPKRLLKPWNSEETAETESTQDIPNFTMEEVLNLQLGKGVESIAYADDLGIIIGAKNTEILKRKVGYAVSKVTETLDSMGIKVAVEKTESVLLAAPRKITNIVLEVGGKTVATSNSVRYLGVMIDRNLKMRKHIKHTVEKANRMLTLLYRLMPRVGGPRSNKRRILASAVTSAVLYGAPTWHQTLDFKHYSGLLTGINRRLAIMIASGYRTVPTTAIEAIAGTIPIDLLVWERVQVHAHGRDYKSEARKTALEKWQERWSCYDGWAKIFIKDVREWTKRKFGEVDFLTTQAMTGHGVFGSYLKKIKKQDDDDCWFCGAQDTPEHSIFQCPRFQNIRLQFELGCGIKISKSNIGDIILQGEAGWKGTTDMLREIMRIKTQEERRREQEARSLNG